MCVWIDGPEIVSVLGTDTTAGIEERKLTTVDYFEFLGIQQLAILSAGMHSPRTLGIQFQVGPPMLDREARLPGALIGERQVVVGIGVGGRKLQGRLIGSDCLYKALCLIQHVAKVEVSQRIAWIRLNSLTVVLFGQFVLRLVVVQSA